jgi:hypothetical protein
VTVGGVLEQTLGLYQRFFWRFAATTAVIMVVLDLLSALSVTGRSDSREAVWALVSLVVGLIGAFWVQGALTLAVDDVRDGRVDTSIGELYERTRPHLVALILGGVLASIGIGLGLVLLIVPGLYLLARWALIVPTIVLEGKSAGEAFSRSSALTAGNRWPVLGVAVVTLLASAVIGGIVQAIFDAILPELLGVWLGSLAAHCVTTPFLALAWTVVYFELRRREQPQPGVVAA